MWIAVCLLAVLAADGLADHIGEDAHQNFNGAPLVFTAMGDWGTGTSSQRSVAQSMASYSAYSTVDFHVTLGDNFYDGVNSAIDPWFNTRWRDIYFSHSSLQHQRWYITVGNHDYYPYGEDKEWNQVARHDIDDQWYFPHLWYCVHVEDTAGGDVDFFFIDTQAMRKGMNNWVVQVAWLESELAASRAKWKVVAGHHPAYTVGNHALGSSTIRNYVVPLLEQYNVDMFLVAHDHNMQHHKKMSVSGATDHILIGGGGRGLYSEQSGARQSLLTQYGVTTLEFFYTYCFGVITFDQAGMHVDVVDDDYRLIYTYTRRP